MQRQMRQAGTKAGADELPAVTRLFTEQYVVAFLLENALGGWWQSRHPRMKLPVDMPYLRFARARVVEREPGLAATRGMAPSGGRDRARSRLLPSGAPGRQISSGTILIAPHGHSDAQIPQPLQ